MLADKFAAIWGMDTRTLLNLINKEQQRLGFILLHSVNGVVSIYPKYCEMLADHRADILSMIPTDITGNAHVTIEKGCYVYFLLSGACVVYVGQSASLVDRVGSHIASKKEFDTIYTVPVANKAKMQVLEAECIRYYNPEYNQVCPQLWDSYYTYRKALNLYEHDLMQ